MNKLKKIKPIGKYVLIKMVEPESRENENGLIIPATEERQQKSQGVVHAIGEEVTNLKVGDEVIFGMFAGEDLDRVENGKKVKYKLCFQDPEKPDVIATLI